MFADVATYNFITVSWTTIVVHNRDQLEIYENPLIERTIMGLMVHIEKQT